MIVSGLREEAGGASTGEVREVARKPADALPGYVKQTKGGLWSRREEPKFIGAASGRVGTAKHPELTAWPPHNEIPIAGGTSFHQRPTHSFPAAPGAHFPGSLHRIVASRGSCKGEKRDE